MKAMKIVIGAVLVIGVLWLLVCWDAKETLRAVERGNSGRVAIENYRDVARAEMAAEEAEANLLRCGFSGRGRQRSEGECLSAMAQEPPPLLRRLPMWPPDPYPNVVQPDPVTLVGKKDCRVDHPPLVLVKGQDPQTHYWVGVGLVTVTCKDVNAHRQGCADLSWDPTGTAITYKIRFQEVIPDPDDKRWEWWDDVRKRCFDNSMYVRMMGQSRPH